MSFTWTPLVESRIAIYLTNPLSTSGLLTNLILSHAINLPNLNPILTASWKHKRTPPQTRTQMRKHSREKKMGTQLPEGRQLG